MQTKQEGSQEDRRDRVEFIEFRDGLELTSGLRRALNSHRRPFLKEGDARDMIDEFDLDPETNHIGAFNGTGRMIGSVRICMARMLDSFLRQRLPGMGDNDKTVGRVCMDPDYQREGIGSTLVAAAVARAFQYPEAPQAWVIADVPEQGEEGADLATQRIAQRPNLYEVLGFEALPRVYTSYDIPGMEFPVYALKISREQYNEFDPWLIARDRFGEDFVTRRPFARPQHSKRKPVTIQAC